MMVHAKQIEEIVRRFNKVKSDRVTWDSHFEDVLKYCLPRKKGVLSSITPGDKRMREVYDGTAIWSLDILAAGLNTFLTSSVNKWFELRTEDTELMDYDEVKTWLQDVEKSMYNMFNGSNFSTAIHETYLDDGSIGTSVLYVEEDEQDVCRFMPRHISEVYILENNKGRIDSVYRCWDWTIRQAYQEWGENIGENLMKKYKDKPDDKAEFIHVVRPRDERNPYSHTKDNLPFESLWVYPKEKHLIEEGGYHEMPFMCARWLKGPQEVYGRSPGMNALSDVKMLNEMEKTLLKAAQKMVDPPMLMPDDGVVGTVRIVPGGINYIKKEYWTGGRLPTQMDFKGNIPLGLELNDQKRSQIKQFFFVDLFLLLHENPKMTATEVLERVEEKMTILGPVLGRMLSEKLDPLIDRCFGIMYRGGFFPREPDILRNQKIIVEYVSPLARVQKLYEAKAVRKTFADIGPYIEIFPELADNVDPDGLWEIVSDSHGFPQRATRTKITRSEVRKARQEAARREFEAEEAVQVVDSLATAKKAGLLGDDKEQALPIQ